MKKIITITAISAALMSSAAFAADNDATSFDINAQVLQECSIQDAATVTISEVEINEGAGSNALLLQNGSQTEDQNIYVSCNFATTITASSANTGLLNSGGAAAAANDSDDFTNLIHYRVELSPTGQASFPALDFRTRAGSSDSVTAGGAFHDNADLTIRIDRDDTSKRPVAGTYTDVATITLNAV